MMNPFPFNRGIKNLPAQPSQGRNFAEIPKVMTPQVHRLAGSKVS